MFKKIYKLLVILVAFGGTVNAQVFIQNTMSSFNRAVYNPAAVGYTDGLTTTLMARSQWAGIQGSPNLITLAAHSPSERLRGGIGGYMIMDKLGPLSTLGANLSYAYKFQLTQDADSGLTLNVGMQAGFLQKALNANFVADPDANNPILDPLFVNGNYSRSTMVPNLGAGLYLTSPGDKFYVGISALDLLEPSLQKLALTPSASVAKVPRSFYMMGGYRFDFNNDMSLQPNVALRTDGASMQFDLNATFNVKPMIFGINHRWGDSFSGIVGCNVSDRFFIAYSYDYTYSGLNALRDIHSHEMVLSYTFPRSNKYGVGGRNTIEK